MLGWCVICLHHSENQKPPKKPDLFSATTRCVLRATRVCRVSAACLPRVCRVRARPGSPRVASGPRQQGVAGDAVHNRRPVAVLRKQARSLRL